MKTWVALLKLTPQCTVSLCVKLKICDNACKGTHSMTHLKVLQISMKFLLQMASDISML